MRSVLTSLSFAVVSGGIALVLGLFLQLSASEHADTRWFALTAAVLITGSLGAFAGFVSAQKSRKHEEALEALERAAERVAQGDLTTTLAPLLGERADQTFRTFDRMTRELRDMRTRLAQTERETAFRDVAQRIAHEIRNPLSPIRVSIESLRKAKQRKLDDFDEIFEESTRTVLDEVQRLQHIVQDFADFARLPKPRPGAVELSALVRDALTLYRPEGVSASFDVTSEPAPVHADREQLVQVLVNLLNNAADAARSREAPQVRITLEAHADGAVLHLDDNGPGVAAADRVRIFEPYFTTKAHGSGLGLAVAERIAREHGGTLVVTDGPLGGARFTLSLMRKGPSSEE